MSPEELARVEAGVEIEDRITDEADDIDELTEQLAAHSIMSEERHDEILERVDQCRTELEKLSAAELTQAENPILVQVLATLAELKGELTNLKSSMDSMVDRRRSESSTPPPETPEEPSQAASTEEPSEENVPPKPPRKNQFI